METPVRDAGLRWSPLRNPVLRLNCLIILVGNRPYRIAGFFRFCQPPGCSDSGKSDVQEPLVGFAGVAALANAQRRQPLEPRRASGSARPSPA